MVLGSLAGPVDPDGETALVMGAVGRWFARIARAESVDPFGPKKKNHRDGLPPGCQAKDQEG